MVNFDWTALQNEAVRHLQALIRLETVNPPGNEALAAEYLADILRDEGIEPVILEGSPGRSNLVARLRSADEAAPLLLMGHTDVVPAEADHWTHPPFAAEIADGYIFGRGAVDMKQMVAMELMVMLLLRRMDVPLRRDVIFMASADEEAGGEWGAGWLVDNHPDLIRAEYALNEGGGFAFEVGGTVFYACQTAEKGYARFALRTRGKPGHASVPHNDNAVIHLAAAIQCLGEQTLPVHVTTTLRTMFETIGETQTPEVRAALQTLLDGGGLDPDSLPIREDLRRTFVAMLHNTATPTMLQSGSRVNVIPSVAEAHVDGRIVPDQTRESFRAELEAVLGDQAEIEFLDYGAPLESGPDSPLFEVIRQVMMETMPGAVLVPYMLTGATDAKHVTRLGTQVYGFSPVLYNPQVEHFGLAHGHDERIAVDSMGFGTHTLFDVTKRFCQSNA
ncbi:MAG: M20/M25/M40 family metallo-hydrolase [Chloroflexi bacterium]|nr:M20/M25/M40 family metallo-hydrolase [Chloroflexota bacterium]